MLAGGLSPERGSPVEIFFKNNKLAKVLNSDALLRKEYGTLAQAIKNRLATLDAVTCLSDVPTTPPERRHLLKGDLAGSYAVDLQHPWRLVFCPADDPPPTKPEGGHDLKKITSILILQIVDYH